MQKRFPPLVVARAGLRQLVSPLIVAILLAGALVHRATAQRSLAILYVDADATGSGNGTSWADAYVYLQDALDQANAAVGPPLAIWVAAGIYYPDLGSGAGHVPGSRDESFTLTRDGIRLYGGFDPGSGVTGFDQRDPAAHVTVLSGDVGRDDADTGSNGIAETWADVRGENAYHVLYLDGRAPHPITSETVVDGFVITGGQADGSFPGDRGGGIYCRAEQAKSACKPTLVALAFRGNQAINGGALYNDGSHGGVSSPTLERVVMTGNRAEQAGGGIYNGALYGTASPTLMEVTLEDNEAASGGGIANLAYGGGGEASPRVYDTLFQNNHATGDGGGMYSEPYLSSASSPMLQRVTFRENQAGGSGGGVLSRAYTGTSSSLLIDVVFERNTAGANGGGFGVVSIYGAQAYPVLIGVTFHGNSASFGGGGMSVDEYSSVAEPLLINVAFCGNQAGSDGGALYNAGDTTTLTNVTFAGNWASGRGGAVANASLQFGQPRVLLANGVLWGNGAATGEPEIYDAEGASGVHHSVVQGGFAAGTDVLDLDPLFMLVPNPGADGVWGSADDDYGDVRLQLKSRAVNGGDNSAVPADIYDLDGDGDTTEQVPIDIDGGKRFVGRVDMGAQESFGAEFAIEKKGSGGNPPGRRPPGNGSPNATITTP